MPSIFKVNDNAALISRLRQKLNLHRMRDWNHYVNQMSILYHEPKDAVDSRFKKEGRDIYDRKFLLTKKIIGEELYVPNGNYGYILGEKINEVYLIIPTGSISFEKVSNPEAAEHIYKLISQKTDVIQEATWDDMDSILDVCNDEHRQTNIERPEFLNCEKLIISGRGGKFRSYTHAPNVYAYKRYILNCVAAQLEVEKKFREINHIDVIDQAQDGAEDGAQDGAQNRAKDLLSLSWFSRSKHNFSWSPLIDGFVGHSSRNHTILRATPNLKAYNAMVVLAIRVEKELKKENCDLNLIKGDLVTLKGYLDRHERDNIFIELFLGVVGIIVAPFTCLIGFIWIIPAYLYDLPYLGTQSFFLDVYEWFIDSLITTARCLIFPIAMIHAYNTTGSSNLLKGECTRIVETLLARTDGMNNVQLIESARSNKTNSQPMLTLV